MIKIGDYVELTYEYYINSDYMDSKRERLKGCIFIVRDITLHGDYVLCLHDIDSANQMSYTAEKQNIKPIKVCNSKLLHIYNDLNYNHKDLKGTIEYVKNNLTSNTTFGRLLDWSAGWIRNLF